jgi:PAS domain S-box-containing protein
MPNGQQDPCLGEADSERGPMTIDPTLASKIVSAAGDAIVTTDSHGYITSWNRAAELLLGVTAERAVGQTLALIIPEAFQARHGACVRAAMTSGRLTHGGRPARIEVIMAGGEVAPLAITLGLLAGADGRPTGAVAVLRRADVGLISFVDP